MEHLIVICVRCADPDHKCRGFCACPADGKSIIEHAESQECPRGYFENPPAKPETAKAEAIPRERWPAWAAALADAAEPEDKGVGDVIERKLAEGGIVFKASIKLLGWNCGCNSRRDMDNAMYPLS